MTFKSKNMKPLYIIFVTTLTLLGVVSCKTKKYTNYQIEGKKIEVASKYTSNTDTPSPLGDIFTNPELS